MTPAPTCPTCGSADPFVLRGPCWRRSFLDYGSSPDPFHTLPAQEPGRKCDLCDRRCPPDDEWSCPSCGAWVCGNHLNAGDRPHLPDKVSGGALDEARSNLLVYMTRYLPDITHREIERHINALIAAERADAERVTGQKILDMMTKGTFNPELQQDVYPTRPEVITYINGLLHK